ncbi:uncharacterized protein LOC111281856 [Durio zibethinus]|uniref:Uncharacterized protein LOC111281856 n=1 Tax=Durio zibethinus TaxID=66656 RepID=A0A6P5XA90_DURZI|nr:uncharacterized protein LOC111281856 [Durio zibethinus]XP_022725324.1 uncharacterized protein LOC111281856 [Durio zibethinus]XP_022725326.1 uncharacterized protein LOC111281856 [Durio zibethinus]
MACTLVISKNLRTAFRNPLRSDGIYMVDPLPDRTNLKKLTKPVKLVSVEALKQAVRKLSTLKLRCNSKRNKQLDSKRRKRAGANFGRQLESALETISRTKE